MLLTKEGSTNDAIRDLLIRYLKNSADRGAGRKRWVSNIIKKFSEFYFRVIIRNWGDFSKNHKKYFWLFFKGGLLLCTAHWVLCPQAPDALGWWILVGTGSRSKPFKEFPASLFLTISRKMKIWNLVFLFSQQIAVLLYFTTFEKKKLDFGSAERYG